jgi:photosystem II stability/assembly factor-like uncharacterized protein
MSGPARWIRIAAVAAAVAGCGAETVPVVESGPAPQDRQPAAPAVECGGWQPLPSGSSASFRGLDAIDDEVVWVSGTGGTWGRTVDGGATWRMDAITGAEELDFRDVDAFGADVAYLMSAGPGELSRIYKTVDGGASWQLQHTNRRPEGFFDGMAFWDAGRGLVYGDPVDGYFTVLATADGGATWTPVPAESLPPALEGEAGFAASGSGLAVAADGRAWFGTGGPAARVFRSTDHGRTWAVSPTPVRSGAGSSGIFSLDFREAVHGVAVGGDYTRPGEATANAARTADGGVTWEVLHDSPPAGYRSGVAWAPDGRSLIAVGTSGSDRSEDDGATWSAFDTVGYHSVRFGSSPCSGWAAGPEGRIARLGRRAADAGR